MLIITALVCLAVLFNVQIYTTYAIWKTPVVQTKTEELKSSIGKIYDRNGVLLADTDEDDNRIYPNNTAVHMLGTVSNSHIAQSGIELAFEDYLKGIDGEKIQEYTTLKGETFLSDENIQPAQNGQDVYLTIDSKLQESVEDILKNAMQTHENQTAYNDYTPPSGSGGAITVLDVNSGEVLAMASAPDFDIQNYNNDYDEIIKSENSPLLNRAAQGLYRPGSTLKTVTAYACLSEGAITPTSFYYCKGEYSYYGTKYNCMAKHKVVTVTKALEVSCNIFFYKASQDLGIDNLVKYEKMFGLGEEPDFVLPTYSGQLTSPSAFTGIGELWTPGQLLQSAIGQSKTLVTPLQMALQAETIANKGTRYSPKLVSKIVNENDEQTFSEEQKIENEFYYYKSAFDTCKQGMIASTVYTYGDYALSALPEKTAMKTGTPESPRGYDSAVIGFYPAENPQIAFSVMLEDGNNAKNAVRAIIESYLNANS